jgi:hypothetical protein
LYECSYGVVKSGDRLYVVGRESVAPAPGFTRFGAGVTTLLFHGGLNRTCWNVTG